MVCACRMCVRVCDGAVCVGPVGWRCRGVRGRVRCVVRFFLVEARDGERAFA
jgi:hypothetical protein